MAVAAFLTSLAGLQAINLVFYDPTFSSTTIVLLTVGSVVSYLCRAFRLTPNPLELPAIALFMVVGAMVLLSNESLPIITPHGIADQHANRMGLFLAWIIVGLSFAGSYNVRLLFSAVPTLAAIGLVSTMSADPLIASLFLIFIFTASFMVVHESCLRAASAAVARGRRPGPTMLVGQLQTAVVCTVAAALLGNGISPQLHAIGSQVIGTTIPLTVPSSVASQRMATALTSYGNTGTVPVGTGPVSLGNQIAMRVRAEHGAYWRSTTFDHYTGHSWTSTLEANYPLEQRPDDAVPGPRQGSGRRIAQYVTDTGLNAVGGPSHILHQTVRFEGSASFGEVFAAAEPRVIRMPQGDRYPGQFAMQGQLHMDEAARIRMSTSARDTQYDVESQVADSTPDRLQRCGSDYPTEVSRLYLTMSDANLDALERIRQAAAQATQGARTNYDRVQALMRFIAKQCVYNTSAKAVPSDRDVVDYFLFDAKEGYCDSFASALAVMCRAIGIPARTASGFISGQLDTNTGWYVVRDRDKHLWTEVYFPTVGWIAFDATTDAVDKSPTAPGDAQKRATLGDLLLRRGWLPPIALAAFLCMLGYVLKVEVLDRLIAGRRGVSWSSLPPSNERIARAYLAACELTARRGIPRAAHQTPDEFAESAAGYLSAVPEAESSLRRLADLATRYCYSGKLASAEAVADAVSEQHRLAALLRRVSKRTPEPKRSARPA